MNDKTAQLLIDIPPSIVNNGVPMYFVFEKHNSNTEFWASFKSFMIGEKAAAPSITGVGRNPESALEELFEKIKDIKP